MFRCAYCEEYYNKSLSRENPSDDGSCICEDCSEEKINDEMVEYEQKGEKNV